MLTAQTETGREAWILLGPTENLSLVLFGNGEEKNVRRDVQAKAGNNVATKLGMDTLMGPGDFR